MHIWIVTPMILRVNFFPDIIFYWVEYKASDESRGGDETGHASQFAFIRLLEVIRAIELNWSRHWISNNHRRPIIGILAVLEMIYWLLR